MRQKAKDEKTGKIWLKNHMRPYRAFVAFLTALSVITTLLSVVFAYVVRYVINSASSGQTRDFWIFAAVLLGSLFIRIALQTLSMYSSERLRAKIVAELRTKLFSKILRSHYGEVQRYHSGDLLNRLTSDVQELSMDTVSLLPAVVGMVVQCVSAIAALLTIDPLFTAIYVVGGGAFGAITALFRKQLKLQHKDVLQADGDSRAFIQEGVSSVMTLKAYGAEEKTVEKARVFSNVYYKKRMKRNVLRSWMSTVFSILSNFGLIFAVVWCSISVLKGNSDYGAILSVVLLLMQLQHPFAAFSSVIPAYYARIASGERLSEIENIPCETLEKAEDADTFSYRYLKEIRFENVRFTYGREQVLCGADTSLKKGEIICLTGASGSGKSTIFKLLLNVYSPAEGNIWLIGNRFDADRVSLSAQQRALFAYVPQGNFLFSGTIYENLTFFSDETNRLVLQEKVKNALHIACAEFVFDLPQGLDTTLKEGGGGLSEGQMQRLAVARAVLSDRPVLLLDEATSALDSQTESRLLENVRNMQDKTCVIVTHRPAALAIADKILCVEKGKIVDITNEKRA